MEQLVTSEFRLGIIAGGQLGKMLALAASPWDVQTDVLDSDAHCPASSVATRFVRGERGDFDAVYRFGQSVDLLTFEIESVNIDALRRLRDEGKVIHPDPEILALIQDKGLQKQFFRKHGIPSPAFDLWEDEQEILQAVRQGSLRLPFVQKARREGYDGRGVAVVRSESDLERLLPGACLTEDAVEIEKELAVIVARNGQGQTAAFPAVEMVFDPRANLVEMLVSPAQIGDDVAAEATALALRLAECLEIRGVLAVEMFLDRTGRLWVNELAPRPHNSGHHTIESAVTSQYEQHLRAVLDLPLGSTELKRPAVLINLLGAPGHTGPVRYRGLDEAMAIPGVKVHIYGKKQTRPFRKMGHITITAASLEQARRRADAVRQTVRVEAW